MNIQLPRSMSFTLWLAAALVLIGTSLSGKVLRGEDTLAQITENSLYFSEIPLPKAAAGPWLALPISPALFDGARWDLADLRLLDAKGQSVPYAVRAYPARSVRQQAEARTFNRVTGPDGASELSLDLGDSPFDHNQVEVITSGLNFRRVVIVEGGSDGENWGKLADGKILRFAASRGVLEEQRVDYPASRFRYLRVRVKADTSVDTEPVEINSVVVRRTIETPGEFVSRDAKLGPREPRAQNGVYGSLWTIDLGGSQVPCQRLEFEIEGLEFNRDFDLSPLPDKTDSAGPWVGYDPSAYNYTDHSYRSAESTGPADGSSLTGSFSRFLGTRGVWRRRAGEESLPMVAELGHVRAGKLRLFVADAANEPLRLESVTVVSPVCLVIFANSSQLQGPLKAYYGNAQATPPNYDFARNLPEKLIPVPVRIENEIERTANPAYVPPPLPFTERWKWLIHCVLGGVSLLLAGLVAQLARRAIARHDARAATTAQQAPGG